MSVFEQILCVLGASYEQVGFVHGNLLDYNIIVRKILYQFKTFVVGYKPYKVEIHGYIPCLIDSEHSQVHRMKTIHHPMSFSQHLASPA